MDICEINWCSELGPREWFGLLKEKVATGEFRKVHKNNRDRVNVSLPLFEKISQIEQLLSFNNGKRLPDFIEWINSLNGKDFCYLPDPSGLQKEEYWIRVNGKILAFEIFDEYEGLGDCNVGIRITYLDKGSTEQNWLEILAKIEKAAHDWG